MACTCRNPDNTLSEICLGTCVQKENKECNPVQQRSDKTIEDRFEYILGIFLKKLDIKINTLSELCIEKYKQGYKDGYKEGCVDGRNVN